MKYLKWILLSLLSLVTLSVLAVFIVLLLDSQATAYLNIKNNPKFSDNSYLIKSVNLVPMNQDTILFRKTVLIEDGFIKEIGDSINIQDVPVVDGKNKFLLPGLIDMHVHTWDRYELGLYLANGVTTIRNLWGLPMHLSLKKAIQTEEILAPLFFTTSPKLSGPDDPNIDNKPVRNPEHARKLVKEYKASGYDYIKTYSGLPREIFDAVIEQAGESEIPIVAHPSFEVDYDYHFHPSISTIEHTEDIVQQPLDFQLDSAKLESVINHFSISGKPHCPTLTSYFKIVEIVTDDEILQSEQFHFINPIIQEFGTYPQYDRWTGTKANKPGIVKILSDQHKFHIYIVQRLHEEGANIVCGTDAGIGFSAPGFTIHQELALYREAGMSNYEALKTATVNPSKVYPQYQNFGTIENGKLANLILTSQNPLDDLATLRSPELVFIRGRKIDQDSMREFIEKAYDRPNYLASMVMYVIYLLER